MARPDAACWINRSQYDNPCGKGLFAEVYRSALIVPPAITASAAPRNIATHIYFLLEQGQFSAFHRILSDELWHFYEGDPLVVYEIKQNGSLVEHLLGRGEGYELFTVIGAGILVCLGTRKKRRIQPGWQHRPTEPSNMRQKNFFFFFFFFFF